MKKLLLLLPFIIQLCGCANHFLQKEDIGKLSFSISKENQIIYYKKNFKLTSGGGLIASTHYLLRIGENSKAHPEFQYVFDGSIEKLVSYNSRIISAGGEEKSYGKGDLNSINLSSRSMVSDLSIRVLPISENLRPGDIIETYYEHESALPQLGISFSLSEIVYSASNITCTIELPVKDSLNYKLVNDNRPPAFSLTDNKKTYIFEWKDYVPDDDKYPLGKKNRYPGILATALFSWKEFGRQYLDLIKDKVEVNDPLVSKAKEITRDKTTPKEKLDAIFEYCQRNIRYEQVYLSKGEFIPNKCTDILNKNYGDCKDYSVAIYTLAKSIGIKTELALAFRGRGREFIQEIPASQFNHMIVHYQENGTDYWYDGTNRTGLPGITTADLINQPALILEEENSGIIYICEKKENLFLIEGELSANNNSLSGSLNISINGQFATEHFYAASELNKEKMSGFLIDFLRENLNASITVKKLTWEIDKSFFNVKVNCELPNSIIAIGNARYSSLSKVFPELFPSNLKLKENEVFYFPFYNIVAIDLKVKDSSGSSYDWDYSYAINPGPFKQPALNEFSGRFKEIANEFNKNIKINSRL